MTKQLNKSGKKRCIVLFLLVIIAVQCIISIHSGTQKYGYHIDELYTYELANSAEGRYVENADLFDTWQSGSVYHDFMSVDDDEAFNFSAPYVNQENDVHPFLYYFVVHFVCSFFRQAEFKWIGIFINLFFCVMTSVFLYILSRDIMDSAVMALIPVAAWAWSVGAASTVVFLRMYAMLGMWCVLFALFLTRMLKKTALKETVRKRCWIGLFLVTAAGTLTQYYFMVFCFFASLISLIYLLCKREWKKSLFFVIAEFCGLLLAYICFPTMKEHIFSGYRGKQAFAAFSASGNLKENLKKVLTVMGRELFNGWFRKIVIICIIVLVVVLLVRLIISFKSRRGGEKTGGALSEIGQAAAIFKMSRGGAAIVLGAACLCYTVIIAKIAPYQTDRYYFSIYSIVMLAVVFLLAALVRYLIKNKQAGGIVVACVVLLVTVASYFKQDVNYLYTNQQVRMEVLADYTDYPVIVMDLATYDGAPDQHMYELEQFDSVFRSHYGEWDSLSKAAATKDLSGGFVIYAVNSNLSDEEFMEQVSQYIDISDWRLLTDVSTHVYFCECEE